MNLNRSEQAAHEVRAATERIAGRPNPAPRPRLGRDAADADARLLALRGWERLDFAPLCWWGHPGKQWATYWRKDGHELPQFLVAWLERKGVGVEVFL